MARKPDIPRIEYLRIRNYRVLRDIELDGISPFTVFLGPNGSGKSTIFDTFAFLAECFAESGLRKAWNNRGRFKELRSRGCDGPIMFELKYRQFEGAPLVTYHLEINEDVKGPYVEREWVAWPRSSHGGSPFRILDFTNGAGMAIPGANPEEKGKRIQERLESRDFLAVNTLGQLSKHPIVGALRRFITGWHLSYLSADNTRGIPESGPQERLSKEGDNLPNLIQYLKEQHPERLDRVLKKLARRVPRLEKVDAEVMSDGRLLLKIKDAPFEKPVMAKYASDGTLKMLAYLALLDDPEPPQLIGIEEPENQLHPRLLEGLAEECRMAAASSQLMVTTHSPFFVNALRPKELWVVYREEDGFARVKNAHAIATVRAFVNHGAKLGHLWMEGHLGLGDPLSPLPPAVCLAPESVSTSAKAEKAPAGARGKKTSGPSAR